MINLTIDLYYYYEYVNMYLVCTHNMARYYFHIVILSVFLYKTVCIFFTKEVSVMFYPLVSIFFYIFYMTLGYSQFVLLAFLFCLDLYYYYEYVNMYLVCTYNMARYYFHIVILSVFLYKTVCIFFTKQHIFICPMYKHYED
jgi:hypothetical protein